MKVTILLIGMLLVLGGGNAFAGQQKQTPFSREEILRKLKPAPGAPRVEQGDLAGEILERGVAFPVDDKVIEELRRAGARASVIEAVRHAAEPREQKAEAPPPDAERPAEPPRGDRPGLRRLPPPGSPESQAEKSEAPAAKDPLQSDDPAVRAAAIAKLPLLEQARIHAAEFTEDLPNFIVTQFVTRSIQIPQKQGWQEQDKLELELTYHTKRGEQFKVLKVNGKPSRMSYEELGGTTSTGEFGSMQAALFAPESRADFKEVKREVLHGKQTVVYDFRVKKAFSGNQITDKSSGRSVITGYNGSVWIEVESGRPVRIEQSADDIQRGFPITMAESAVEYEWVTIAGAKYLMPVYAEVIMGRDAERQYSRNIIELKGYRVFDTDIKILPEK